MDATLFVHPAQLMAVIQKKDQIDCKFYRAKKTVNSGKEWVEYVPHFWRLKCGPIGRSQRKSLSFSQQMILTC